MSSHMFFFTVPHIFNVSSMNMNYLDAGLSATCFRCYHNVLKGQPALSPGQRPGNV